MQATRLVPVDSVGCRVCAHAGFTAPRGCGHNTSSLFPGPAECCWHCLGYHGSTQPGYQARAGAPTLTHCAILVELVPLMASLLVCKIRKADPTFCKVSPGYITHLHTGTRAVTHPEPPPFHPKSLALCWAIENSINI